MTPASLKALQTKNRNLRLRVDELRNQRDLRDTVLQNSLSGLVGSISGQANITSFNPLIENNIYAPLSLNWILLTYMYKTHGVLQTAIDMPVLDALRGGLELQSKELDADDLKVLEDALEENGILESIGEAMVWARLYGGAGLIINTDQDMSQPLTLKRLSRLELYAANRWELGTTYKPSGPGTGSGVGSINPWEVAAAKTSEKFNFYGKNIHASRVLTIAGKAAPYIVRWQLQGWGMSEIERMVEDFNGYVKTKNVIYELLEEAKIDVYGLKDFKTNLATQAGTNLVQKRIEAVNRLKNFQRALIMDSEDTYDQKQVTFAGLAEMKKENRIDIASALRMPFSKLFGTTAGGGGLANSGQDDLENYNAMVESEIREKLRRPIRKVLGLMCIALFGEEFDITFKYKPLRIMTAKEEEEVKTAKHARYTSDYDRGLLTSKEFGEIQQKEGMLPIETAASKGLLDDHPAPAAGSGFGLPGGKPGDKKEEGKGEGDGE